MKKREYQLIGAFISFVIGSLIISCLFYGYEIINGEALVPVSLTFFGAFFTLIQLIIAHIRQKQYSELNLKLDEFKEIRKLTDDFSNYIQENMIFTFYEKIS